MKQTCQALFAMCLIPALTSSLSGQKQPGSGSPEKRLTTEKLRGSGTWVMAGLRKRLDGAREARVTVWFDEQLLGDGQAYKRRALELRDRSRIELRTAAVTTLKELSARSYARAKPLLDKLHKDGAVRDTSRHWIVNGLTCTVIGEAGLASLLKVPGIKKVFLGPTRRRARRPRKNGPIKKIPDDAALRPFDPKRYKHPWYTRALMADRVWKEFGITGTGTLNVIHDGNFVLAGNALANVFCNPGEIPGNGKDDDGNGLVDDYHGYNFAADSSNLTVVPGNSNLHGTSCAAIICGTGTKATPIELGIAPRARWAGVIAGTHIEAAIEWAIERGADTYSMSFSIPGLGEYRSHWRKVMEHGSLCGLYFVSGAGNFARRGTRRYAPVPVQMRTPEDIPEVVFAAAGVQRDLSRTEFSSQGPVEWNLDHYKDGRVQKPEVCAFNFGLPTVQPDGQVREIGISGNSFAGPMFCGSIALMLAADPELLPWDLKEIITGTALDVGPPGVDGQTGHGLINCYRAVKEVLRRRAVRENKDPSRYTGRVPGDVLDLESYRAALGARRPVIHRVPPNSRAYEVGIRAGDVPLRVDGRAVATAEEFAKTLRSILREGKARVTITLRRGESKVDITTAMRGLRLSIADAYSEPVFR